MFAGKIWPTGCNADDATKCENILSEVDRRWEKKCDKHDKMLCYIDKARESVTKCDKI